MTEKQGREVDSERLMDADQVFWVLTTKIQGRQAMLCYANKGRPKEICAFTSEEKAKAYREKTIKKAKLLKISLARLMETAILVQRNIAIDIPLVSEEYDTINVMKMQDEILKSFFRLPVDLGAGDPRLN